jgi:hypothetical protein
MKPKRNSIRTDVRSGDDGPEYQTRRQPLHYLKLLFYVVLTLGGVVTLTILGLSVFRYPDVGRSWNELALLAFVISPYPALALAGRFLLRGRFQGFLFLAGALGISILGNIVFVDALLPKPGRSLLTEFLNTLVVIAVPMYQWIGVTAVVLVALVIQLVGRKKEKSSSAVAV